VFHSFLSTNKNVYATLIIPVDSLKSGVSIPADSLESGVGILADSSNTGSRDAPTTLLIGSKDAPATIYGIAFGWLIFYGKGVFHHINCQNLRYKFWLLCINPISMLMIQGLYILVRLRICATNSLSFYLQNRDFDNFYQINIFKISNALTVSLKHHL